MLSKSFATYSHMLYVKFPLRNEQLTEFLNECLYFRLIDFDVILMLIRRTLHQIIGLP